MDGTLRSGGLGLLLRLTLKISFCSVQSLQLQQTCCGMVVSYSEVELDITLFRNVYFWFYRYVPRIKVPSSSTFIERAKHVLSFNSTFCRLSVSLFGVCFTITFERINTFS